MIRTPVPPGRPLNGRVSLPGSKSVTNRALLIAALARGRSTLRGGLESDDTGHMATALGQMGVRIGRPGAGTFVVTGPGEVEGPGVVEGPGGGEGPAAGRLMAPAAPLVVGNAGTAARFLTAAATLACGTTVVDGNTHMRRRPIMPLVAALADAGVTIDAPTGCPPVTVTGRGAWTRFQLSVNAGLSSQYVSALLMVAACQPETTTLTLAADAVGGRGYIALTEAVMSAFGAAITSAGGTWTVAPTGYRGRDYDIPPDASAATYFQAAAQLTGGRIDTGPDGPASAQPDSASAALIGRFPKLPAMIDGSQIQDSIPTLAVLAAFADRPVRFHGIANLRVKECDRIAVLCAGLNRIRPGLAEEQGEALIVRGRPDLPPPADAVAIDPHDDHRMAMSFALAGLRLPGIGIRNPGCVAKTFPGYWQALESLGVAFADRT